MNKTILNNDKVYDAYMGLMGIGFQRLTQQRLNWIAKSIKADNILDIGCSQGILDILLGRENKKVTALDIDTTSIDFAKGLLEKEDPSVQKNVQFLLENFTQFESEKKFSDILLGEVLEHNFFPASFINKAHDLLEENGHLIVTLPFGKNEYFDHVKTYYLTDFIELVKDKFTVTDIQYIGRWICFCCVKRLQTSPLQSVTIKRVQEFEHAIAGLETQYIDEVSHLKTKLAKVTEELGARKEGLKEKCSELSEALATFNAQTSQKITELNEKERQIIELESASSVMLEQLEQNTVFVNSLKHDNAKLNSLLYQRNIEFDGMYNLKLMKLSRLLSRIRQVLNLSSIVTSILQLPKTLYQLPTTLVALTSNILRKGRALRLRKKIIALSSQIPDSNGSSYYKKFDINIAIITDEFMYNYYKDAANLFYVNRENYKEIFEDNAIDLLLFVSCWKGMQNGDWADICKDSGREGIQQIFNYASTRKIPIVFQTIEDPPNYVSFLPIARQADVIFTTDDAMVSAYKTDTGNDSVYLLDYGINPFIQNPIGICVKNDLRLSTKDTVFFAGTWYKKYEERCKDAAIMFDGVKQSSKQLLIADRNNNHVNYRFPEKYNDNIISSLEHLTLQKVHKLFNWNINLNSIKSSPTMCAMRVYELQALGSLVLSNYALSVSTRFPNIFVSTEEGETENIISHYDGQTILEMQTKAIRNVFSGNTVFERLRYIFEKVGIKDENDFKKDIVVLCKEKTEHVTKIYERQEYPFKKLLTESELLVSGESPSFVAFFSDEYTYESHYLEDLINGFKYTDVCYTTKSGQINERKITGVNHNYIDNTTNKYKSLFNLNYLELKTVIENDSVSGLGYSIDPFGVSEAQITTIPTKEVEYQITVIIPLKEECEIKFSKAFLSLIRSSIFNQLHILFVTDPSLSNDMKKQLEEMQLQYPNIRLERTSVVSELLKTVNTPYVSFLNISDEVINDAYMNLAKVISSDNSDIAFGNNSHFDQDGVYRTIKPHEKGSTSRDQNQLLVRNIKHTTMQSSIVSRLFLVETMQKLGMTLLPEYLPFIQDFLLVNTNKTSFIDLTTHVSYVADTEHLFSDILLSIEQKLIQQLKEKNLFTIFTEDHYQEVFKNHYIEKLLTVKDKNKANQAISYLEELSHLYGKNIEKQFAGFLDQIPESNGSSFYKKIDINIAVITDNLAFEYYKDAANLFYVNTKNFREVFQKNKITFLLFISCWYGMDNNDYYGIGSKAAIKEKVYQIVEHAKSLGIPVVFQSKEDPSNYNSFIDIAKRADYIFTTAIETIPSYRKDTGNDNVSVLEYGINPLLHNPVGFRIKNNKKFETNKSVLFAGSWYDEFPDRCKEESSLFLGVVKANKRLVIVDRNYFKPDHNFIYPDEFQQYIYSPVKYRKLQKFHKLFDWSLNLNIVRDSLTMCAARVFELQAIGNAMISNPAISVAKLFPNIKISTSTLEVKRILVNTTPLEVYQLQVQGIRNVYSKHTVYNRLHHILEKIGLQQFAQWPTQVIVLCKEKTEKIVAMFNEQTYADKTLLTMNEVESIGGNKYLAFFSEEYSYGKYYLEDMINGFKYTDVVFVTKQSTIGENGVVEGVDHDYVHEMVDKYKTIFNLEKITLDEVLEKDNITELGYSIDPFEIKRA